MYPSATNIGVNPTFNDERPSIETYILDFEGDLYGRELEVEFVQKIRDEARFDGLEALVAQMNLDARDARRILAA